MSEGVAEQREIIRKRIEYVELLSRVGPLAPRDIVDELDHSRSTVTRALEELRETGLVERRDDGYSPTVAATMAADEHRRHQATSRDILEASELLEPLGEEAPPSHLLVGAHTHVAESSAPFRPLEMVSDELRTADAVRAYLPTLVNPSLLRLWHRRVATEGIDSVGLFDETLLTQLQGQYPGVLGEMNATDTFSAYTVDGPPYGLLLTVEDGTPTVTMIVYDGEGSLRGVVVNESPAAVEWARTRIEELEATATSAADELSPASGLRESAWGIPQTTQRPVPEAGARPDSAPTQELPVDLKTEGFVRLTDDYFEAHDRARPIVSWQTGFTLAEVRAGHAVDRIDEDGTRVADRLIEGLREGTDHVLVGLPGAGKSTTCMAVACDWFDQGLGPVLYRERGQGDEFTSTALLEAYLRQTDGHTLIVIEDAIRREANAVFDLMQVLGGHDDITFLLDSRQSEWDDSEGLGIDPRVSSYRRTSVREISMPELGNDGYERFAKHFEQLVGDESGATHSSDEFRTTVADGAWRAADDGSEPGTALLAQAQLSRTCTPVSTRDPEGPNALDADIMETYRSLSDAEPELATDLAVLVNLLNAAGIPVTAEYLYALAADGQFAEIDAAISVLEGKVIFDRQSARGADTQYRTRHEEWSRRFLEELLELLPEAEARASFGRCVSRFLSLADDSDRRARIRRQLSTSTPRLSQIEADSTSWADEVIERVFTLGQSHSRLAPLYGRTGDGTIELPDACSAFTRHKQAWWRADMNGYHGSTERAKAEVERLTATDARSTELTSEEAKRLRFHGHRGLSMYHHLGGQQDTARDHATRALALAENLEEIEKIAQARNMLFYVDLMQSALDSAREHLAAHRELVDEYDASRIETMAILGEGRCAVVEGAHEEAKRKLQNAREQAREGNMGGIEAEALSNLGYIALMENEFERAESSLSSALEITRSSGRSMASCLYHSMLARLARKRGDIEDAESHLERAVELASGVPRVDGKRLRSLALVERDLGNLTAAANIARESVEMVESLSHPIERADALTTLAQVTVREGDFNEAEQYLDRSREMMDAVGNQLKLAVCDRVQAHLEFERENLAEAERLAREGLQTFGEMGIDDQAADCRWVLGLVALERENISTAREQLTTGLESAEESGVVRRVAQLHEAMGQLEMEAGEPARARGHQDQAIETFERLGDTDRVREIRTLLVE